MSKRNIAIGVGVGVLVSVVVVAVVLATQLGGNKPPTLNVLAGKEIVYRTDKVDNMYTKATDDFVTEQERILDIYRANLTDCDSPEPVSKDAICIFKMSWLSDGRFCSLVERWGFNSTSPCLLVTPVKDPTWKPEVYTKLEELPVDMPQSMKDYIEDRYRQHQNMVPAFLWLSCSEVGDTTGQTLSLYPWRGLPAYYFPAKSSPAYMQPVVALPLTPLQKGVKRTIECRFWAKNVPEKNLATIHITME